MFTGIVEELGVVESLQDQGDAVRLAVRACRVVEDTALGDSIAVNGVCLTVAERRDDGFTADVMRETLVRTTLGALGSGSPVNLERAVTAGTRLGGHIVSGHVDGTGKVVARTRSEHWEIVEIAFPSRLAGYLVEKGSVTVDGVSLTVVGVHDERFTLTVSLIPETLARTTLGTRAYGDEVNLEVDMIAKYVERLLAVRAGGTSSEGEPR